MSQNRILQPDVNVLCEIAIALETRDAAVARALMSVAYEHRPQGPVISRKMREYRQRNLPALDIGAASLKAAQLLRDDMAALSKFLPVARKLVAEPAVAEVFEREFGLVAGIAQSLNEMRAQNDILRAKLNEIHKALCYSDVFKVREIDDPAGRVSPVEVMDRGSPDTVLAFGGMLTRLSMPTKEFFGSLVRRGANVIFVKDFQQCWYLNGLMGLTSGLEDTADYLRTRIPSSTRNLTCLGTSAGGYAAIRFGVALKARKVTAFSPQTDITDEVVARFKSLDTRVSEFDTQAGGLDLRVFLEQAGAGLPDIDIHYGKGNPVDKAAAERLQGHARLHPYDTTTHAIAQYMKEKGLLDRALAAHLGGGA